MRVEVGYDNAGTDVSKIDENRFKKKTLASLPCFGAYRSS